MAGGVPFFVPRVVVVALLILLATATLTFAAEQRISASTPPATPARPAAPATVVVPDVTGQAYVFAKGTLEESGFAWRVAGPVEGYAANVVLAQNPAAGTALVDTAAPTMTLQLRANGRYGQQGTPEPHSPYGGTRVERPETVSRRVPTSPANPKPVAKPTPKPAAKPVSSGKPVAKPAHKPAAQPKPAAARPPAFVVPGAPKEPLDEIPLPARARQLDRWVAAHAEPTNANVNHWLYQHTWIVSGAKFGWFQGAEALRILVEVDKRVQASWGIGAKSEAVARAALATVQAKSR